MSQLVADGLMVLAGAGVGTVFGLWGAGGSAFATPVLALLGVPAVAAVASPLAAMVPATAAGTWRHLRAGTLDRRVATWAVIGGLPATLAGAAASARVGGDLLLLLSGLLLLAVGVRILWPESEDRPPRCTASLPPAVIVSSAAAVGFLTGLLANGGGLLLVPLFVVGFGLSARMAAGTSMVTVGALTLPTVASHWALGHIDWRVAIIFGGGMLPGTLAGARLAEEVPVDRSRQAFGLVLVGFAGWFLWREGVAS